MTNNDNEPTTTKNITFRFASGQVLRLHEDQIAKIPYLTAMVSSADRFESARDEAGHYKLDPHIKYEHFSFILKSLSFHSVRQLFTHLPIEADVIPIIALFDFLGLESHPGPSLNEIDSTFFSTVVYSPFLKRDIRVIRVGNIQDMAVRFGIAMAKEEYDFTKSEVPDQIYWFVMFILSTRKWFGPNLRHHVYKIAEHTFILFKPSLLKSLNRLNYRSLREARIFNLSIYDKVDSSLTQTFEMDPDYHPRSEERFYFMYRERRLSERQDLLLHGIYNDSYLSWFRFWSWRKVHEDDLLEPIYRRTLEVMYEELQYSICQRAIAELRHKTTLDQFKQRKLDLLLSFHVSECKVLPKSINNIFKDELVQEKIRAFILERLCFLTPQLERRYAELLKKIREFQQDTEMSSENLDLFIYLSSSGLRFESMQKEALSHELLLEKLHQDANIIVRQIEGRVLDGLYEIALKQFNKWGRTRLDVEELLTQLNSCQEPDILHWITLNAMCQQSQIPMHQRYQKPVHQQYQIPAHKPLLKHQFKHSKR